MKHRLCAVLLLAVLLLAGCAKNGFGGLQDGYYSAEAAELDEYGWKEFVTILVSDGKIITVEYNARNASGFMKSWDMAYMRAMRDPCGTYPNKYTREYANALIQVQTPNEVDIIAGATHSHSTFQHLARAAILQAEAGDPELALVHFPKTES